MTFQGSLRTSSCMTPPPYYPGRCPARSGLKEIHMMSSASAAGMSLAPRQDAHLQAHRSPPPQNKTTDTSQVDRYQCEQAYDGTQMVCDARALAYRLVHRLTQRRALPKQG